MAGGTTDDIWQRLNQQQGGAGRGGVRLTGLAGIPGVSSRVSTTDSSSRRRAQAAPRQPSFIESLAAGAGAQGRSSQQGGSAAGGEEQDEQAFLVRGHSRACHARLRSRCLTAPPRPALARRAPCSATSTAWRMRSGACGDGR